MAVSSVPNNFPGCRVLIVEDVLPLSIQYRALAKPLGVDTVVAASAAEARRQIPLGPWHAALQHAHTQPGVGQAQRGGASHDAAADDDDVRGTHAQAV